MGAESDRRTFLASTLAGIPLASYALASDDTDRQRRAGRAPMKKKGRTPIVAISSANGREATKIAYNKALKGADTLDAVVAGVAVVEDDPKDTVGRLRRAAQ